mmetsp:Transcript_23460/g.50194  ORF Transcript_23460/g.50194 Transcript_23460/m.50194 type:complete len:229 (-) Transcript_23460:288-974(-)
MRYEYQPPSWLSEMEPTRALRLTTTVGGRPVGSVTSSWLLLLFSLSLPSSAITSILIERRPVVRISGDNALVSIVGPTTFTARVLSNHSRLTFARDRSGPGVVVPSPSIPATLKRASTLLWLCAMLDASVSMEDCSSKLRGRICIRSGVCLDPISFSSLALEGDRQHAMILPFVLSNRLITNCNPMPRFEPVTTNTASGSALRIVAASLLSPSEGERRNRMSGKTGWP